MKILVLASNSFSGSHFVEHVLEKTDFEVCGISRSPEYDPIFLPYLYQKAKRPERFQFHQLDMNQNMGRLVELLDVFKPDAIVNFAAQGEVRNSWQWPEDWYQTNVLSFVQLGQEIVKRKFIKKFLNASTPEVYGNTGQKVVESQTYSPSTPYGVSKLTGDLHYLTLQKRYGLHYVMTRAANVYGIHQQLYRIIPKTIISLMGGQKIPLHGEGKAVRSFVHARDVADAMFRVLMEGQAGHAYHVAPDDDGISIAGLVQRICNMMGRSFDQSVEMMKEDFGQDALFSMSSQKIRKELGWAPQVELDLGIRETIKWVEIHWNIIKTLSHQYVHKK